MRRAPGETPPSRAWRAASLPCLAVLGIALPLTFASVSDQFLFDFRRIDLLPIYATAWLVLAAVVIPLWILLTLGLRGMDAIRRTPGPLLARGARLVLIALAVAIGVEALIYCIRIWLVTFGVSLGAASGAALVAAAVGILVAVTERGRSAVRSLATLAAVCTALGALSLVSLPVFGWPHATASASLRAATSAAVNAAAGRSPHTAVNRSPGASPDPPAAAVGAATHRPNILLLTIDALSAQHMSLYGAARPTTPSLDAFARGATTFDRAYADANFTTPGIASILTGTRPWTHRALQLPVWPLDATRRVSLPAVLRRDGYRTGYVSTNPHAGASAQGFGAYFAFARTDRTGDTTLCRDGLSSRLRFLCAATELPPVAELERIADRLHGPRGGNLEHDPRLATEPALAWLRSIDRSKPLFLWVHLFPPHAPYAAPSPWLGRFDPSPLARDAAHTQPSWVYQQSQLPETTVRRLEARYDESVAYVDHYAGLFLDNALRLLGPDTVVVVTADHGESFGHGYGAHTGPGLYDEIIHIPLIIKLPGQTVGRRSETLAEQVDIAPTLARLAGITPPASWEGRSLLGDREGGADDAHAVFSMSFEQNPRFAALRTGSVAVIQGQWKLVHYMGALHYPFMPALHDELYDLAADPGERNDLAARNPAEVRHLRTLIDAQLARRGQPVR